MEPGRRVRTSQWYVPIWRLSVNKHLAGRGAAVLALAVLAACGAAQTTSPPSSSSTTSSSVAPTATPTSSTATKNGVTAKVTLSSTRAQAGDTIAGTVAVTNDTKTSITRPLACKDEVLAVALSHGKLTTAWAWSAVGCTHAFAFKPGTTTTLPVSVITSYNAKNVFGPLPAGRYQAKLYLNLFPLPVPAVIPVVITAAAPTTD